MSDVGRFDQYQSDNLESAWDINGLPKEYAQFVAEAGGAGGRIIHENELVGSIYRGDPEGLGLTGLEIIARAGAAVAVAALLEKNLIKPEALELLRVKHEDPAVAPVPIYTISEEMRETIHGILERTNHPPENGEARGEL